MSSEAKTSVVRHDGVEEAVKAPSQSLVARIRESGFVSYWQDEWKPLVLITGVFLICYYIPVGNLRFDNAVIESFYLVKWYAQEHVLLCLVPAFFIAGAIGVFVSQEGVMKYLGPTASKWIAYPVASISGTVPRRLLMHGIASFRWDLDSGRRPWPSIRFPLFRTGH